MAQPVPPDPTAQEFESWRRPSEVLALLEGMGRSAAAREVYRRLANGMLFAAGSPSAANASGPNDPRHVISPLWWKSAGRIQNTIDHFWKSGGIDIEAKRDDRRIGETNTFEFFGVRLEPNDLQRLADDAGLSVDMSKPALRPTIAESANASSLPAANFPHAGGRPRKDFWDDLIIETARRIFEAELQPKKQRDIEDAMHEWLIANQCEAGERSVRERAKKIWVALCDEGKN